MDNNDINQSSRQGVTLNEMWELSRMSYMGAAKQSQLQNAEEIEEFGISMNEKKPPFLKGNTTKAGITLSPVKLIKNP